MKKYYYAIIIFFIILLNVSFSYARIPEIVLKQRKAVVTIYIYDKNGKEFASGTGFIIKSKGIIVTNYHVMSECVENEGRAVVKMENGAFFPEAKIINYDEARDIAIFKIDGRELPTVKLAAKYKPELGEDVIVIGSPLGLETTVSDGVISSVREETEMIQITAPVSHGSSGSPVFNSAGEVIGVATAIMKDGQNLNFAIPVKYVEKLFKSKTPGNKKVVKPEKPQTSGQSSTEGYGKKLEFNGGTLYYTSTITLSEADRLGQYLVETGVFNGRPKAVQINKTGSTYEFKTMLKKNAELNEKDIQMLQSFSRQISDNVFGGASVEIHICDESMQTIKIIKPDQNRESAPSSTEDYGQKLEFNKGSIYYTSSVSQSEVNRLGGYLVKEGYFNGIPKDVMIGKKGSKYEFKIVVNKEYKIDNEVVRVFEFAARDISDRVFAGAPVEIHLCDENLQTIRIIKPDQNQESAPSSTEDYGQKLEFNGDILYYTPSVSLFDAKKFGKYLVDIKFFIGTSRVTQINKNGSKYEFKVVMRKALEITKERIELLESAAKDASDNVFGGYPVEIHLCDENLRTRSIISSKQSLDAAPLPTGDYGQKLEFNGGTLYYTSSVGLSQASRLGKYLAEERFFDGSRKDTQIDKEGSKYEFRMVLKKGYVIDEEKMKLFRKFLKDLSDDVFGGAPVEIHLCDEYFKTINIIQHETFPTAREISTDVRFIAYDDDTILDKKTHLMWASKDNGSNIEWKNAKSYCENYKGGGYSDWRMPTLNELAGLYDESREQKSGYHLTGMIRITHALQWSSETEGTEAAAFYFLEGDTVWTIQSNALYRVLPVRNAK